MWIPSQPIEGRRQDRFRPPFCPYEDCPDHTIQGRKYNWSRKGFYSRKRDPNARQREYLCGCCHRKFAHDAFAVTYRMKRPELVKPVAAMLNAGCADRQIARTLGCSKTTVARIAVRLGKHAELVLREMLNHLDEIQESITYDHFETFVGNQTNRLSLGTAVGSDSGLVYDIRGVRYRAAIRRAARKRPLKTKTAPTEPGRHILELDLVYELVAWFSWKNGGEVLRVPIEVLPAEALPEAAPEGSEDPP